MKSQEAERPHSRPKHTVLINQKNKEAAALERNGENGWTGGSWVNANTQEVVFALK